MQKLLFAIGLFFPMLLAAQKETAPNQGQYAQIRGFKMYFEEHGKGEPLLFIHGNGGSAEDFKAQVPFFSKNYRVILADSRAQGRSADPADSLSYEMMADDFNALLDHLKIDSCRVVGWSDGGINALLLAIRHPHKVRAMAITGANLWPDTTAVDNWTVEMCLNMNDSLALLPQTKEVKDIRKLTRLLSYEPHISTAQLAKINSPTLVIGGDNDVIKPAHTMLIAQSLPQSYLWILPGSGHSTPVVFADLFNLVVGNFFQSKYKKFIGLDKYTVI